MIFRYLANATVQGIYAWARDLVDDLNTSLALPFAGYPVCANDVAAQAANVPIGGGYVTPDGIVKRRLA